MIKGAAPGNTKGEVKLPLRPARSSAAAARARALLASTPPPRPIAEPLHACRETRRGQHLQAAAKLIGHGLVVGERGGLQRRGTVAAQAGLRESSEFAGQGLGGRPCLACGTTRLTRPMASASEAATGRPVRI